VLRLTIYWSIGFIVGNSSTSRIDALSVSVATLCRTARENSGKTVGALALEGRLTQAKRLLAGTDLPVAEVAAQVGIADYNYFSRLFRRETQMSPRRYRAAVREGTLPSPEGEK
jgi:AraC-like DNA-binding protein